MTRPRVLMACPNYWDSPFQVGSHHLARAFVRAGWDVAFISDPITPLHLAAGWTPDLRHRLAVWRSGGRFDLDGRLWTYVPASLAAPHRYPLLRSAFVHRHWHRWTWPGVVAQIRRHGFDTIDLLYVDSVRQTFWLDALSWRSSVYRATDYTPLFDSHTAAAAATERRLAAGVDLVVYPSPALSKYVDSLGPRRQMCLPNGVSYEMFAQPAPRPPEYATLPGPIAVYVGSISTWFHFEWLRHAARCLPQFSFVLIGPDALARQELSGIGNIHLLGSRAHALIPGYLQHADVGLLPFDATRNPEAIEPLNPLKLYEYLASGLPVVSSSWAEIRRLASPARLCETADEFVAALRQAAVEPGDASAHRRYAAAFDWQHRVTTLLEALSSQPLVRSA